MNTIERLKSPKPPFFKRLQNISLILAGISTAIITAPITLPAIIISFAGYIATAAAVAAAVSQLSVESKTATNIMHPNEGHSKWATLGGTVFCLINNLHQEDLARTAVLAAVGAAVSYLVSRGMRWLFSRARK